MKKSRETLFCLLVVTALLLSSQVQGGYFQLSTSKLINTQTPIVDSINKTHVNLDEAAFYKGGFSSWQEQLNFAIAKGGHGQILHLNGLKLVEYKDSAKDLNLFIHQPLSFNSHAVIPKDETSTIENFKIERLTQYEELRKVYNERKNLIIRNFELDNSLKLINLIWSYNGEKITTYCVVSDNLNAIIYDDFLSNITVNSSN